jgi:two-component system, chemotaxis family, sensor kinase CheA
MSLNYTLFDPLLEPIFILNRECKVVYCNGTAATLISNSVRKIMRSQPLLTDLFQFSEKIEAFDSLIQIEEPTPYKEVNFTTTDGISGKIQITIQKLPEIDNWITFIRDVTLEERLQNKYRAELDAKEGVIEELKKAQAELENYSRNLEKMVEERTAEIRALSQKLKALLDSLDQGFLIFDENGLCWEIASKACEKVLECSPAGKQIWDVIKLPENEVRGFSRWLTTLYSELLPFEDLAPLGPAQFQHSQGNHVKLDYYPIRSTENKIQAIVLVATDITSLVQAQEEAEKEKANSGFILKMFKQKRSFLSFFDECQKLVSELNRATLSPPINWDRDSLFRILHTIKGGCASFSIREVALHAHELESMIQNWDSFNESKWDDLLQKLQNAFDLLSKEVNELLGKAPLKQVPIIEVPKPELLQIFELMEAWSKSRDWAMQLRNHYLTEPIQQSFEPYNFVIQETAEKLNKKIKPLRFLTPDFRWNFDPYAAFSSTLVHVFRNAIDHGLETPEERMNLGKPEQGEIQISAFQNEFEIELRIQDDGRGISTQIVREKRAEKGLPIDGLTDKEIVMSIFEPQFSTRKEVTELSGRGVGLDAVKFEIAKIGGSVDLESQEGKGTTFIFKLPLNPQLVISLKPSEAPNKKQAA